MPGKIKAKKVTKKIQYDALSTSDLVQQSILVVKRIQCKSCAGISSEQVCMCVLLKNSTNKLNKNI